MSTRILFGYIIGLLIISSSLCSTQTQRTVVRKSKVIMITKNIRECMRCTRQFSDKFLQSVDYIQIPTKKQLSYLPLSRKQISIIVGCKSQGTQVSSVIEPTEYDSLMIKCIKKKSEQQQVSSQKLQDLYLNCLKKSEKCPKWRGTIKLLSNKCDEDEEENEEEKILGCIINECNNEIPNAKAIFSI